MRSITGLLLLSVLSSCDAGRLMGEAQTHYAAGEYEEAVSLFRQAADKAGDPAVASLAQGGLAKSLLAAGRPEEALDAYQEVLELQPRNANALAGKARALQELGRLPESADSWREALEAEPEREDYGLRALEVLFSLGEVDAAEKLLADMIAAHPESPGLMIWSAWFADRDGDRGEAIRTYRRVLESVPADTHALSELGRLLLAAGRSEEALEVAERLIAIEPGTATALTLKASCLAEAGRVEEARALFERARRINPPYFERAEQLVHDYKRMAAEAP